MIAKLEYGGKTITLKPYLTSQERDILIYSSVTEKLNIDDIIEMLSPNIEYSGTLTKAEKISILYKLREISIGDEIDVKYACGGCKRTIETSISVSDIIENREIRDYKGFKLKEVFSNDINKYVQNINADELDIDVYDDLADYIEQNKVKFSFEVPSMCPLCNHINNVNIEDTKFIIDNLSEDVIATFYKSCADMIFHGNYSKESIDNMYPFERNIFIGLLNKQLEEKNK